MLDMVRLAREIPRRAQGKGRKASVALEPLAMGSGTGDGFTWTAAKHQRLTLFKRAGRNIGYEAGARIAHRFGIFWTCGRFNDTVAEGLHSRIGSHQRHIETTAASHKMALGDHVRLDDFDPGRPFHGAEVLGGDLRLFGRDALADIDHLTGITLSLIPTGPGAVLEIVDLLQDVLVMQTGGTGVIGAALAIGVMAEAACVYHGGLVATGHHLGQLWGIPRIPIAGTIIVGGIPNRQRP